MYFFNDDKLNDEMNLKPPSFFKKKVSEADQDFDKILVATMQLYIMKNNKTDAATQYQENLNKINGINTSLLQIDSDVKTEINKCNTIITNLDSEISSLKNKSEPEVIENAASKQQVSEYSDNYKNKLYTCIVKGCIIGFFLINVSNYKLFFLFILVFVVIKWFSTYVRSLCSYVLTFVGINYPEGPKIPKVVDSTPVGFRPDNCFGSSCCDVKTTKWVSGSGCVQL